MHIGRNADEYGRATQRGVEHYRAFAAGGAGLVIQEEACILPDWTNKVLAGEIPGRCCHCKVCHANDPKRCAGALILKRQNEKR